MEELILQFLVESVQIFCYPEQKKHLRTGSKSDSLKMRLIQEIEIKGSCLREFTVNDNNPTMDIFTANKNISISCEICI